MLGWTGRWLMLGAWMVMKWPVLPVSAIHDEVKRVNGVGTIGGGEETDTLGVVEAETVSVTVAGGLVGATDTENARGSSAGPLS